MEDTLRTVAEEGFSVVVPPGWEAERDLEEGGLDIWDPEGPGDLHLVGFSNPGSDPSDPAEELYAFLEDQGIELEEDEIEDFELADGGALAICEYLAEEEAEEGGEVGYSLLGVAALPGWLVFAQYTCEAGTENAERSDVLALLRSIRPAPSEGAN
jgi:hypothetical protein